MQHLQFLFTQSLLVKLHGTQYSIHIALAKCNFLRSLERDKIIKKFLGNHSQQM